MLKCEAYHNDAACETKKGALLLSDCKKYIIRSSLSDNIIKVSEENDDT